MTLTSTTKIYYLIFIFLLAKSDEKDRLKQDKKAEEKAAKQEKKREKEAIKNKKMLAEHSSTTLTNNSLNASSSGTSRKLYEDELDPSEDYINECEMSSGIQMMTFRSSEAKGNFEFSALGG